VPAKIEALFCWACMLSQHSWRMLVQGVLERTMSGAGGTVHLISSTSKAANPALARQIQFLVMPPGKCRAEGGGLMFVELYVDAPSAAIWERKEKKKRCLFALNGSTLGTPCCSPSTALHCAHLRGAPSACRPLIPADDPVTQQSKQVGERWRALGVPCVCAQYLIDYIAKPWGSLDAHVLLDTHEAASGALCALRERLAKGLAEAESDCRVSGATEDTRPCEGSVSEGESVDLRGIRRQYT